MRRAVDGTTTCIAMIDRVRRRGEDQEDETKKIIWMFYQIARRLSGESTMKLEITCDVNEHIRIGWGCCCDANWWVTYGRQGVR